MKFFLEGSESVKLSWDEKRVYMGSDLEKVVFTLKKVVKGKNFYLINKIIISHKSINKKSFIFQKVGI